MLVVGILVLMIIILMALFLLNGGLKTAPSSKKAEVEPEPERSAPADAVLTIFDELPEENRPVSRYEMESSLDALDFKYGIEKVHHHFDVANGSRWVTFIRCSCTGRSVFNYDGRGCKMPEYKQVYDSLVAVKHAIDKREKALAEAAHRAELEGRKFDLDRVVDLTARFRNEAQALSDVAEELGR